MKHTLAAAALAAGLMLTAVPVMTHHSFAAEYDAEKPVKLTGTITKVEWINPHAWIHIDVKKSGAVESWMIETGAPTALLRRGIKRESLPAGTEITVEGYRARDGATRANGRYVTYADGRGVFTGSSGTGAPDETPAK